MLGGEGDGVDVRRFIERWRGSERSERAAAQQHFLELCEVLEVARPGDPGQPHADYDFERRVRKPDGREGRRTCGGGAASPGNTRARGAAWPLTEAQ